MLFSPDMIIIKLTNTTHREHNHKLNSNPYHKDHFNTISKQTHTHAQKVKNYTIKTHTKSKTLKKGQPNKIKRVYYNKYCYHCNIKDLCTKSEIRIITEYENKLAKIIEQRMETPEAQEEYKKRSHRVELPFRYSNNKNNSIQSM